MRSDTLSRGPRRLRSFLVVNEVALALVLMVGAGLLLQSFERLTSLDPGFEADDRLSFRLTLPPSSYPEANQRLAFQNQLVDRLSAISGVRSAAVSSRLPLDDAPWSGTFHVEGYEPGPGEKSPGADFNVVGPGYFDTLGIPLIVGRDFAAADHVGAPRVVVVDTWTAERFWPGSDPIGKRIYRSPQRLDYREVIGVVGHVTYDRLDEEGRMQIYMPATQAGLSRPCFTVHTALNPALAVERIRTEVAGLNPKLPVYAIRTLYQIVSQSIALPRFHTWVLGGFAVLAVVLSATGLYGVLAFSVSRRTAEIGTRMALGATTGRIISMVMREAMGMVAAGLALGGLLALWVSRALSSMLYAVEPTDPMTYVGVALLLIVVALVAAWVPAFRAARLNPVTALRAE